MAASVWMKLSNWDRPSSPRPMPLTMPWGDGLADAERIADGQDDVSDLEDVRAAQAQAREIGQVDLQQRQVGFLVGAHEARRGGAAVRQHHPHIPLALDNVMVRHHVTLGVHDDPGPQCGRLSDGLPGNGGRGRPG
jgi:hypothetical protein